MTLLSLILGTALIKDTLLTLEVQHITKGELKELALGWLAQVSSLRSSMGHGNAHFASEFFFSFFPPYFADNFHRKLHQNNRSIKVHPYAESTASGPLRAHLLNRHAQEWVEACQEQNIALRGKEGEEALARVSGVSVNRQAEVRAPFTQDNFLDALVQFIVGTDQVFFAFSLLFLCSEIFLGYEGC